MQMVPENKGRIQFAACDAKKLVFFPALDAPSVSPERPESVLIDLVVVQQRVLSLSGVTAGCRQLTGNTRRRRRLPQPHFERFTVAVFPAV